MIAGNIGFSRRPEERPSDRDNQENLPCFSCLHGAPLMLAIGKLSRKLSDTYAIAASEAYAAALLVYRTGKQVQGSEGISEAVAELARRFERRGAGAEESEATPEAENPATEASET